MSCNCNTNPCGCDSGIELPYLTGSDGNDGLFGGYSAQWKFDASSILSSPTFGYVRFNANDYSSATEIYINELNASSINHADFLDVFDNSGNYGLLKIWKRFNSNVFYFAEITNIVDNGTDRTLTVSYIASGGTFANDDDIVVSFVPKGNTGEPGADGADGNDGADGVDGVDGENGVGAYVVDAIFDGSVDIGENGPITLGSLTVPANTMSTNEDMLEFSFTITRTEDADPTDEDFHVSFGDQGYDQDSNESIAFIKINGKYIRVNGRIIRISDTSVFCELEMYISDNMPSFGSFRTVTQTSICKDVQTFDPTSDNLLQLIVGSQPTVESTELQSFVVKYTKRTS